MAGFNPMGIPLGNIGAMTGADFSPYMEMVRTRMAQAQAERDRADEQRRFEAEQQMRAAQMGAERESQKAQLGLSQARLGLEKADLSERARQFDAERSDQQAIFKAAQEAKAVIGQQQMPEQPESFGEWVQRGMPGFGEMTQVENPADIAAKLRERKAIRDAANVQDFRAWLVAQLYPQGSIARPSQALQSATTMDELRAAMARDFGEGATHGEGGRLFDLKKAQWAAEQKAAGRAMSTPEDADLQARLEKASAYMQKVLADTGYNASEDEGGRVWQLLRHVADVGDPGEVLEGIKERIERLKERPPIPETVEAGATDEERAAVRKAYKSALEQHNAEIDKLYEDQAILRRLLGRAYTRNRRMPKG